MKVGNIVKWSGDFSSTPQTAIVIDTCMIDGLPHATVFWFDLRVENHHPYMDLTTISRA
tara:strand:- start:1460 stop:1636 length:177 start_codon:yes stop_codon:yes gene_type:complete